MSALPSPALVWGVIAGMAAANFLLRFIPIALVSRRPIPRFAERWLSYIPVSVMAALVAVEVLRPGGVTLPPWENPYLAAALPTAVVFRLTRSLLGATVAGIACFLAARWLLAAV